MIYQRMTEAISVVNLKELIMFFIVRLPEQKSRTIRSIYFHYPYFKYFVNRAIGYTDNLIFKALISFWRFNPELVSNKFSAVEIRV